MSARHKNRFEQELFDFAQESDERKRGVDELFAMVGDYAKGRRFMQLLERVSHFSDYSPYNALLIVLQRPQARYVFTPKRWLELHRTVRRDARPIVVLRPFSPVMYLFDEADTRVAPGQTDRFPYVENAAPVLSADPEGAVPPELLRKLLFNLPYWGIAHGVLQSGPSATGQIVPADSSDPDLPIALKGFDDLFWRPVYVLRTRRDVSATDMFAAVVQELAHLFCRHLRGAYEKGWAQSRNLSPDVEAFEALVTTWLVSRRRRVASPSYAALADWFAEHSETPDFSFDTVIDAVTEIERLLGDCAVQDGYLYRHSPAFVEKIRRLRG